MPVTTIANNIQEDNERIGVGRGGTGNFKRPPPASRFLPGHPGSGTRSNTSSGSASSCHQSATSDARPYSPPRPSNGSFATGRSIQPIPHATTHATDESSMPSSTAVAQFHFNFTEQDNEHNGNVNQRSQPLPRGSDMKTRYPSKHQQQGEKDREHQYHHPLETSNVTELKTIDSNSNLGAAPFPASAATSRRIFSATQTKFAPIELTALPQVQPTDPPPSMSPIPFQSSSSPSSPNLALSGTADPTHLFVPPSAIAQDEKFVCGRGGFANIARETEGTVRQHRSLVDYLASKRKKGSNGTSNKNNNYDHSDGNIDESEKKKSWWRKGKAGHQHIGTSVADRERAELQPVGAVSERSGSSLRSPYN